MNIKDRHIKFYQGRDKDTVWRNWGKSFYKYLDVISPNSVCDVGCGSGAFLVDLVTKYNCEKAYGVDIATVELELVIEHPSVEYFSADAGEIPLGDKSVDLITAFDSLEHVSEDKAEDTLREFARIARKGFMFSIMHRLSGESCGKYNLHSCVNPKEWWYDLIESSTGAKLEKVIIQEGDHSETIWKL